MAQHTWASKAQNNKNKDEGSGNCNLWENLTCCLCNQLLVDAVTIRICLHSACHRCLNTYVKSGKTKCPKCNNDAAETCGDAASYASDPTLQDLVYKLGPKLYWRQVKRKGRSINKANNRLSEKRCDSVRQLFHLSSQVCAPTEHISLAVEYVPMDDILRAQNPYARNGQSSRGATYGAATSSSVPQEPFFKRYFRCEARTKLADLKRVLEAKLGITSEENYALYFVDSKLRNLLEGEHSIQDVMYISAWGRTSPLRLPFTIARLQSDEDIPPVLDAEELPQETSFEKFEEGSNAGNTADHTAFLQIPRHHVTLSTSAFEKSGGDGENPPPPIITTFPPEGAATAKKKHAKSAAGKEHRKEKSTGGDNKKQKQIGQSKGRPVEADHDSADQDAQVKDEGDTKALAQKLSKKKKRSTCLKESKERELAVAEHGEKCASGCGEETCTSLPSNSTRLGDAGMCASVNGVRMASPPAIPPQLNPRDAIQAHRSLAMLGGSMTNLLLKQHQSQQCRKAGSSPTKRSSQNESPHKRPHSQMQDEEWRGSDISYKPPDKAISPPSTTTSRAELDSQTKAMSEGGEKLTSSSLLQYSSSMHGDSHRNNRNAVAPVNS